MLKKKNNKISRLLSMLLILLACQQAYAQKATVRATIQPSEIMIGEQAVIDIEVIAPKGRQIQFPIFQDTLVAGVEVLGMLKTDTVLTEVMKLNQKYVVTSFDSTLYHIPYLPVLDGNDTLHTNDIGLKVTSPQLSDSTLAYLERLKNKETDSIDFAKLEIKDAYAQNVVDPPFVWQDYLQYILWGIGLYIILILIVLAIYMFVNKRKKGYFFTPKVVLPPHVVALQELEELRTKQLCQRGLEKEYYTQLTDIIREYIAQRYGINATEMISDDIIQAVHRVTDTTSPTTSLEQILRIADLVKFAKYIPLPNENDLSLVNALLFVNQTKLEEETKTEDQKDGDGQPAATEETAAEEIINDKK